MRISGVKRNLSVLDLRDSPWLDGPGRTVLECAEGLNSEHLRLLVGGFRALHQSSNKYLEEAKKKGLPTVEILERGPFDLSVLRNLLEVINKERVNLVHTHELRSNFFGLLAARRCGIPVVTTVHGWIANDFKGTLYGYIDRVMLRFFDQVISVSHDLKKKVIRWGVNPDKIIVVPNTLELDRYQIDKGQQGLRTELGLSDRDVLIAKIGRFSPEKGHKELLQAFKKVAEVRSDVHLALLGKGPEASRLRKLVDSMGLGGRVHFCGFRQDMVACYNSFDLVVQASYTEGMPNVILEALAMGVPVIATNVGGTGEIVKDGLSGRLIPPGQPDQLAGEIMDFLGRPNRYAEMSETGRNYVFTAFDSRRRIRRMGEIYTRLAAVREGIAA